MGKVRDNNSDEGYIKLLRLIRWDFNSVNNVVTWWNIKHELVGGV